MTPEQKLAALFAADTPPARDYAFQIRAAERIAARRAWMTVGALVPWVVAVMALLWALAPVAAPFAESMAPAVQSSALVLAIAGGTLLAALWMARRFQRGAMTAATPK